MHPVERGSSLRAEVRERKHGFSAVESSGATKHGDKEAGLDGIEPSGARFWGNEAELLFRPMVFAMLQRLTGAPDAA